jgi:hypothetical protein
MRCQRCSRGREPVGYDIEHASERRELVARLLLKQSLEAAK